MMLVVLPCQQSMQKMKCVMTLSRITIAAYLHLLKIVTNLYIKERIVYIGLVIHLDHKVYMMSCAALVWVRQSRACVSSFILNHQ
jgi:hypothetical protein